MADKTLTYRFSKMIVPILAALATAGNPKASEMVDTGAIKPVDTSAIKWALDSFFEEKRLRQWGTFAYPSDSSKGDCRSIPYAFSRRGIYHSLLETNTGLDVVLPALQRSDLPSLLCQKTSRPPPKNQQYRTGAFYTHGTNTITDISYRTDRGKEVKGSLNDMSKPIVGSHELFHLYQDREQFLQRAYYRLSGLDIQKLNLYGEAAAYAYQGRFIYEISKKRESFKTSSSDDVSLFLTIKGVMDSDELSSLPHEQRLNKATQMAFNYYLNSQTFLGTRNVYLSRDRTLRSQMGNTIRELFQEAGLATRLTLEDLRHVTTLPNGFVLFDGGDIPSDEDFIAQHYPSGLPNFLRGDKAAHVLSPAARH